MMHIFLGIFYVVLLHKSSSVLQFISFDKFTPFLNIV